MSLGPAQRCQLAAAVLGVLALASACPDDPDAPIQNGVPHTFFPIEAGDIHALDRAAADGPIDCVSCHGDQAAFQDFSCVGCHEHRQTGRERDGSVGMDELHVGQPSYRYQSPDCLRCHPNGQGAEITRAEHDEHFPIERTTAHGLVRCGECHLRENQRAVVTCTGCHRDTDEDGQEDHSLPAMLEAHGAEMADLGYAWRTGECLDCHERSQVPGTIVHAPFPIALDQVNGEDHDDVKCAECHGGKGDRKDLTCTECHAATDDGSDTLHGELAMFTAHADGNVPGYQFVSRSCFLCHKQSQVPGTFEHDEYFPIGDGSEHDLDTVVDDDPADAFPGVLVQCSSCHEDNRTDQVSCTTCHVHTQPIADPAHAGFPDYRFDDEACVFCHLGGVRRFDHAGASPFPVTTAGDSHLLDDVATAAVDGLSCGQCHASVTDRHEMRCATCHDHDQPTALSQHGTEMSRFGYVWESNACLACHPVSQVPGLVDHEPEFPLSPPSGAGAHEPLSCRDCHLDPANRRSSLACTACHQPTSSTDAREVHGEPRLGEVHSAFPEYIWSPQSCVGCHPSGTAAGAVANLDHLWFPVDTGDTHALASKGGTELCADCHGDPADYAVAAIACISCHEQVDDGTGARDAHGEERLGEIHTGVDGYLHDGPTCLECHPNGEATGNFVHVEFPIATGSAHQTVTCSQCHDASKPKGDLTGLRCAECHGSEINLNPTVTQIHGGMPGFVDASPSCYGCHPNAEPSPPFDHEPFFPILSGSAHGAISCDGCHINPSNRANVTCTGCHTDADRDGLFDHDASAMLAAHGPDMSALGYQWSTSACRSCHARAEVPGVLDHEAAFPVAGAAVHSGLSCASCHTDKQQRAALACTGCHTLVDDGTGAREVHGQARMLERHLDGTVPGYTWDPQACFGCHQQSQVPGVMDHERFFPIGVTSAHPLGTDIDTPPVTVACATCHANPDDATDLSCTGCHAHEEAVLEPTHGLFPDYTWDSTSCVFCHQGGQKILAHPFFPVEPGDVHAADDPATPAVDGRTCGECHASQTNRTLLACTTCHQHSAAQATIDHGAAMASYGYRYDSGACFTCHARAQVPGVFDHEPIYPLQAPSGDGQHAPLVCADCHGSKSDRAGSLTCTACHQPTSGTDTRDVHGQARLAEVHAGFPGYAWTPRICIGCHSDGTAESAAQHLDHVWFPTTSGLPHAVATAGNPSGLLCADCHTTGDYAAFDCLSCHRTITDPGQPSREVHSQARLDLVHQGVGGYSYASPDCYDCHPNGEPSGTFDHLEFPVATGDAHAGIGCAECHDPARAKSDLAGLYCAQCHATENTNPTIAQIHNGIPDFANSSPECFGCHPNAEPVGPMDHTAYFPIAAGSAHASAAYMAKVGAGKTSCSACHASRTDRTNELCATCHASVTPVPTTTHSAVRGFSNTSPLCKACHAESTVKPLSTHPRRGLGGVSGERGPSGNGSWVNHHSSTCQNCHIDEAACLATATCYNDGSGGQVNPQARPGYRTDKPWAYDFKKFGCLGCHKHKKSSEDNRHLGDVNGYVAYGNPKCKFCH
ncbi:MAG: hypothetical protein IT383_08700 [Deltaproteobacteria bacterium]|nr:hypothetical protein [Deltaproteobacteria bacterium]